MYARELNIVERSIHIRNRKGLHARPASLIAQAAQQFQAEIQIIVQGQMADAKSILDILCLAIPYKAMVTIKIRGPDAREAMAHLLKLFNYPLDETGFEK